MKSTKCTGVHPGDFAMLCPTCHRAVHKELNASAKGKESIAKVKARLR